MTLSITAQAGMRACGQPVPLPALSCQGAQGADELSWIGSQILPVTLNSHPIWNQGLELVCSEAPGTDS